MSNKKKEVKFIFDNEEAAENFLSWLCNSGEQQYWDWMENVEPDEKGPVTVVSFDYWQNDNKKFGEGDVYCECGRLNRAGTDDDDAEDGAVVDETEDDEDVNEDGTKTCPHCKKSMSWSPSGHYCGDTNCRGFQDDGSTC